MHVKVLTGCLIAAGSLSLFASHLVNADRGLAAGEPIGADVAACSLGATTQWGLIGDIHAFSIQSDSFNKGDEVLLWEQNTSNHPVIAQNLYRYHDGRLEMIGMSWVKHGFCALQLSGCGDCETEGGCPQYLKPGCRDPYSSFLNGSQARLGPRSEVNASTGKFPYPYELHWQETGDAIFKRLQVHDDDLNPELNEGALYYIEGHYVHPQEGTTDLRHNNATYEQVNPTPSGSSYSLGTGFNTVQFLPAIFAWQDNDPEVVIETVDIDGKPVDGRFHVAYRVFDNEDGTWRYEYAVHNLNSHRSARGFTVPLNGNIAILDTYYNDVPYHSGEPFSNDPWELAVTDEAISWMGESYDANQDANALRWSTMYNFAFVADAPPTMGEVTLTLFRPGDHMTESVPVLVPETETIECTGDLNDDGQVNVLDLLLLLESWGSCPGCEADLNDDDEVNVLDLLILLENWGDCP